MGIPKILLADPSRFYLELEKGFLQRTSACLLTATAGDEALALIRNEVPVLIYMALDLPGTDGAACCHQIKQDPRLQAIPVILLHEQGRAADVLRCRAAGCDAVLEKPLTKRAFLTAGKPFLSFVECRDLRYPCRQLVVLRYGNDCGYGTSVDLSEGGMYVGMNWHVREQSDVHVSFVLPESANALVEATSRVAWLNHGARRPKPGLPYGIGLQFLEIHGPGRQLLANFIDQRRNSRTP